MFIFTLLQNEPVTWVPPRAYKKSVRSVPWSSPCHPVSTPLLCFYYPLILQSLSFLVSYLEIRQAKNETSLVSQQCCARLCCWLAAPTVVRGSGQSVVVEVIRIRVARMPFQFPEDLIECFRSRFIRPGPRRQAQTEELLGAHACSEVLKTHLH